MSNINKASKILMELGVKTKNPDGSFRIVREVLYDAQKAFLKLSPKQQKLLINALAGETKSNGLE